MKRYIQRRAGASLETVDEFDSNEFESLRAFFAYVREMVVEYNLADNAGAYYVSRRPCKAWSA